MGHCDCGAVLPTSNGRRRKYCDTCKPKVEAASRRLAARVSEERKSLHRDPLTRVLCVRCGVQLREPHNPALCGFCLEELS